MASFEVKPISFFSITEPPLYSEYRRGLCVLWASPFPHLAAGFRVRHVVSSRSDPPEKYGSHVKNNSDSDQIFEKITDPTMLLQLKYHGSDKNPNTDPTLPKKTNSTQKKHPDPDKAFEKNTDPTPI